MLYFYAYLSRIYFKPLKFKFPSVCGHAVKQASFSDQSISSFKTLRFGDAIGRQWSPDWLRRAYWTIFPFGGLQACNRPFIPVLSIVGFVWCCVILSTLWWVFVQKKPLFCLNFYLKTSLVLFSIHWRGRDLLLDRIINKIRVFQAGGKAGKDSGKAKAKAVSRSARAGLQVSKLPF